MRKSKWLVTFFSLEGHSVERIEVMRRVRLKLGWRVKVKVSGLREEKGWCNGWLEQADHCHAKNCVNVKSNTKE